MIHIDIRNAEPEAGWLQRANDLTQALENAATQDERNQIIDDNADCWGELKEWLLQLSHGKCWFSEARDVYSHWDVEHFRPKKSAKNKDKSVREGYWWLAFNWANLRICGNVGNRKKGTFFPLRNGSAVATSANRITDDEIHYLLDPTKEADANLLSFDETGDAIPMPDSGTWNTERAEYSIARLKLNDHVPLPGARRDVWQKCRQAIDDCVDLIKKLDATASAVTKDRLDARFRELQQMVRSTQEFSAVARECLNTSGFRWALRIASSA